MKKSTAMILITALLLPFIASAVTWQMDSNPFSFGTPIKYNAKQTAASQLNLWCQSNALKGIVTIMYHLPGSGKGAKLTIYNTLGVAIKVFTLKAGSSSVQWNFASEQKVTGIYMAAIRCGNIEKKTQLSIVK
jgi:hypothetical protein